MKTMMVAMVLGSVVALPALAQSDATGGPAGGPNQAQSVVPSGATGGKAGGPHQAQSVKKSHKKVHH